MFRIVICDHDKVFNRMLRESIEDFSLRTEQETEIHTVKSIYEIREMASKGQPAHMILVGLEVPDMNGYATIQQLRSMPGMENMGFCCFGLSHQAFRELHCLQANKCFLKPVDIRLVLREIQKEIYRQRACGKVFVVKENRNIHRVPMDDIHYFEGKGHQVLLHTKKDSLAFYSSLMTVEHKVRPFLFFVRIHRNYLINFNQMQERRPITVYMSCNEELPIGEHYQDSVFKHLHRLHAQKEFLDYGTSILPYPQTKT